MAKADYALFPRFCKAKGVAVPVAEYRFHPTRKHRMDFRVTFGYGQKRITPIGPVRDLWRCVQAVALGSVVLLWDLRGSRLAAQATSTPSTPTTPGETAKNQNPQPVAWYHKGAAPEMQKLRGGVLRAAKQTENRTRHFLLGHL